MVGTSALVGIGLASVALPALALVAMAVRNWEKPGARGFAIGTFAIACWSVTTGLRILVTDPALVYGIALGQVAFTNLTVLGWALLVAEFLRRRRIDPSPARVVAVAAIPVLTVSLAATNDWHHLLYAAGTRVDQQGFIQIQFGPWYPVHLGYLLAMNVVPAVALVRDYLGSSGLHRRQVVLLVTAWGVAFAGTFDFYLKNFGTWPFPPYVDVSPLGFLLASLVWGLALFRHGLLKLVPIARRTAVETMPDAVLTVDVEGTVVDANPAAEDLFDDAPVRRPIDDVLADHPELLALYREDRDGSADVPILRDGEVTHFSATTTPITDRGTQTGTLIVLRDVTALKSREQELDLHRQVHSRIVRHNLRNGLTIIRGNAEEIARAGEGQVTEFATTILDRSDELVGTSEKARHIMRIIEDDGDLTTVETCSLVDTVAADMREEYPDAHIETTHPGETWATVHEDLEIAIRNLVENAVEHSSTSPDSKTHQDAVEHSSTSADSRTGQDATVHTDGPRVEVSVDRLGETVEIAVTDDGPGIPDHEISVLDQQEETALEHGSGAGLWLVNWIAMKSEGTLEFSTSEDGTTVTLRLQAATVQDT